MSYAKQAPAIVVYCYLQLTVNAQITEVSSNNSSKILID